MPTRDKIDIKFLCKVLYDVVIKDITYTSFAFCPFLMLVLLWISPQNITQKTLIRYIARSLYHLEVSVVIQLLAQTSMHAQYFIVNKCGHRKLLKHANKLFKKAAVFLISTS